MKQLSIIIPSYNREHLLRYTLDSVHPSHHPGINFEVIVVDDGSTDNTLEMLAAGYRWVRILKNNGKGAPSARNMGLNAAEGNYVLFLDSDDLIGPGYLKNRITHLDDNPDTAAVYGNYDFFRSDGPLTPGQIIFKYKYPAIIGRDGVTEHLANYMGGNYLPLNTLIWRKELLQSISGYREYLKVNQDVDLFIRALLREAVIDFVADDTSVYIRDHNTDERVGKADTTNREKWQQILELRRQLLNEMIVAKKDSPQIRSALSGFLFYRWRSLRHASPDLASQFLQLAKDTSWPVTIKGSGFFAMLGKIFGPVIAVKIKYFLLRRD